MIAFFQNRLARLRSSPIGNRLTQGLFWSVLGMVAARGSTLVAAIVAARMLGKEEFGELGMIQNTAGMFAMFAGFGMGLTATKHVAEFRQKDPHRAGRIIALSNVFAWLAGSIMTLVLFALAGWMARHSLKAPQLETALKVGALLPLLASVNGAQLGALTGFEAFRSVARLQLVIGVISFPMVVAGARFWGVNGVTLALVVSAALGCCVTQLALNRECRSAGVPVRLQDWRRESQVVWRFSLPAVQAYALVVPVNWYCSTVMLAALPEGDAQVGIFTAANQWFTALMALPNLIAQAVLPLLAEQLGSAGHADGIRVLKTSLKISSLAALPLFLLAAASPVIMGAYGKGFSSEWPTMVVMVVTAGLLAVQTPVAQAIVASGNVWSGFWMNAGWAVLYVVATYFLVHWGALGVATARLAAYVVHGIWTFWFAFALIRHKRAPQQT